MKKLLHVALGVVTSLGGFLEAGSIATSVQAGAEFGYSLLWVLLLGVVCLVVLIEMSGRLAAVSHHTIAGAMRERFGFSFFLLPLVGVVAVSMLTLAAELGGVGMALQLATGIGLPWGGTRTTCPPTASSRHSGWASAQRWRPRCWSWPRSSTRAASGWTPTTRSRRC